MKLLEPALGRGAAISSCWTYRFLLWRVWQPAAPRILFVGVNPSTATAHTDDATVRRLYGFAHRERCGGLEIVNLFAYRSSAPSLVGDRPEPVEVDAYIDAAMRRAAIVVAAWGNLESKLPRTLRRRAQERAEAVAAMAAASSRALSCLGLTSAGFPRHPLFVRGDEPLVPFGVAP